MAKFILLLTVLSYASSLLASHVAPVIDLGYTKYQGVFDEVNNLTSYLGMRYAAPPLGDLRFRAPRAPLMINSSTVEQANTQPQPCFQGNEGLSPTNILEKRSTIPEGQEDCLFLNVFFPGDTIPTEPLPTLIWIHGGGYAAGDASGSPGQDFVRESHNQIVVVVIQYRLGLFGFLAGSEVKESGDLNVGLLDQHFAFQWVQKHISQFGGDKSKVSIWGESAGAGSVIQHVVAQGGQTSPQLFRGAITSSTYLPSQYWYNDTVPESLYSEVVDQANCSSASDSLSCLRAVDSPTLAIINSNVAAGGFFGTFLFVPVVDGTFITQRPTDSLKEGRVNGQAYLGVTNANEGIIFVNQSDPIFSPSLYASTLFPGFDLQQANETAKIYDRLGGPFERDELIYGESIVICPTYYMLSAFPNSGWKGEFAIPPAEHVDDIYYYFTSLTTTPFFNNSDFLAAFQGGFLSFVISQNPNDKIDPTITPAWSLYSQGRVEMVFNKTANDLPNVHAITTEDDLIERCAFWNSVGEFTAQ